MKKINIVGVLVESANWILHPVANYKELQEYREDYEREVSDFHKRLERMNGKMEEKEQNLCKIYAKYDDIRARLSKIEFENETLKKEIQNTKSSIKPLKSKLAYRDRTANSLKEEKRELKYQIQKLEEMLDGARNQVVVLAKKLEFYEKQTKKTPKEKVDYLMKRGKK